MNVRSALHLLAAASVLGASFAARAMPVTYDFAGTGDICTPSATGEYVCVPGQAFTGSVTIDVIASGPAGPDGETDGQTYAFDDNGWVNSHFTIAWGGHTADFGPLPNSTILSESFAEVDNNLAPDRDSPPMDGLTNFTVYEAESLPGIACRRSAFLERRTLDTSWLSDLSFDVTVGLAPGSVANNAISFQYSTTGCIVPPDEREPMDVLGNIVLSSFAPRAATIKIDIRPNVVNPKSKGTLSVAALGSSDFDATQLDFDTVKFGPGAASPAHQARIKDVNGDGFMDTILRFRNEDVGIACGDTDATLTGSTFSGAPVQGTDSIRTVGCKHHGGQAR